MTAFQSIFVELEKGLKKDGFHVSRFQILFFLYFGGPLSAADLARHLLVTRGNISMFLKRLERDRQIRVCPSSPSMRRPVYRLTKRAETIFETIFPKHIARVQKLAPALPPSMTKALLRLGQKHPLNRISAQKE